MVGIGGSLKRAFTFRLMLAQSCAFFPPKPMSQLPQTPPHHSAYRPDIDGLRAVAVSLVVAFHAFPEYLPGGFVGVDIFFIISGYLISSIILGDLRRGHFSFTGFYARRVRRIFPALLFVLALCAGAGWFLLLPDEYQQLGKHIAGGAGFVANIVLWTESGYFDAAADLKPLLHLWSLGIEEQFYFLWPLLLWFAWKRRFNPLWLALLLTLVSFGWNIIKIGDDPVGTFYLPQTRFWELMSGCILACLTNTGAGNRHKHLLALAGTMAVIIAVALLDKSKAFPGAWALLPTTGACLIITAGPFAWINRRVLAHPVMVFVGLLSFPMYLWHWPLLSFARILEIGAPPPETRLLAALASLPLAWLTYRLVEKPIRFHGFGHGKTLALCLGMGLVFVSGYGIFRAEGFTSRMREKAEYDGFFSNYHYTKTHDLLRHDRHECNFYDIQTNTPKATINAQCYTPHSDKVVFIWGDSHAQHLNHGLQTALPDSVSILQVGSSGCPPSASPFYPDPLSTCNKANRFALEKIKLIKPAVVVLAQQRGHEANAYGGLIAELQAAGVGHVLLLGPVPQWEGFLYKIVLKKYWQDTPRRLSSHLDAQVAQTDAIMRQRFAQSGDVVYVSLITPLCDGGCIVYLGDDRKEGLFTYDYGHFTLPASDYVAKTILVPLIQPFL